MPRTTKDSHISVAQFRELLERNNLRQEDAAWICGVGSRQARGWATGEYGVPQYAALLLQAYDEKLITAKWLRERIGRPPP